AQRRMSARPGGRLSRLRWTSQPTPLLQERAQTVSPSYLEFAPQVRRSRHRVDAHESVRQGSGKSFPLQERVWMDLQQLSGPGWSQGATPPRRERGRMMRLQ